MSFEAVVARFGSRFLVVTILPNVAFFGYIGVLVAAGVPGRRPTWSSLVATVHKLSVTGLILFGVSLFVVSVATHPLHYPLIQIVEGYWLELPFGKLLVQLATRSLINERQRLKAIVEAPDGVGSRDLNEAQRSLSWLPKSDEILPTVLGNVLKAGEVRAGSRYRHQTSVVLPRLMPLLSELTRAQLNDVRDQMDAAVRLCVLSLAAMLVSIPALIKYDVWMLVPLLLYLFAWGSYRASIAAAKRFCSTLAVAFDLHHLDLWDALQLPRPANMRAELSQNELISQMLRGWQLTAPQYERLMYVAKKTDDVKASVSAHIT